MADDPDAQRLRQLEDRIARMKAAGQPQLAEESHYSQAQQGWRMVIELVSGLLIGFAIGYALDRVFHTLPFLMVTFTLLGFAAGVRVMIRTARELQADNRVAPAAADKGD